MRLNIKLFEMMGLTPYRWVNTCHMHEPVLLPEDGVHILLMRSNSEGLNPGLQECVRFQFFLQCFLSLQRDTAVKLQAAFPIKKYCLVIHLQKHMYCCIG